MRRKREAVLPFEWNNDHLPKTVREYRQKYKGISRLLDENPEILDRVHEDLKKLSQGGRRGREADFTSETILRALVVHAVEGLSLRETVILIAGSDFLQDFLRTRKKAVMDFTFLDKCLLAIGPATWRRINESLGKRAVAAELEGFLPAMAMTVEQARRRVVEGETVPAAERVFSIFEPHTELIKRGRRQKPVEFGHAVLLCQTPEKFITDYEVFEERPADCRLTGSVIDRHEKLFGAAPEVLAADKGFCPDAEEYARLEERIDTLAIPRRMRDFAEAVMRTWQAFRAGIEGTISGLKRAFRLSRCFNRGFKGFASAMGLGVFSHNLIVLAKRGAT